MTIKKTTKKKAVKTGVKEESVVIEKPISKKSGGKAEKTEKSGVSIKKPKKYDIEGKFIHIKVGDSINSASNEDITIISNMVDEIIKSKGIDCILFVTHHAVDIDVVG